MKAIALVVGLGLLALAPTSAAVSLRVADYMPATHYLVVQGMKPFLDEVTKETNGAVQFEYFPAQQLGKAADMLQLVQTNSVQISNTGILAPGDRMALSGVTQLPGMFAKACDGLAAYMKIARPGTALYKHDYDANGVHLLWINEQPPFQLYMHGDQVTRVEDLRGLKILAPMRPAELALTKLGAVPIQLTSGPQAYDSLLRGVADGTVFNADAVFAYDMVKLTKTFIRNSGFGGQTTAVTMNLATWNGFDRKTQGIMTRAADRTSKRVCAYVDAATGPAQEKLIAAGDRAIDFPPDSMAKLQEVNTQVRQEWAKELDGRGLPATQVLNEYVSALRK